MLGGHRCALDGGCSICSISAERSAASRLDSAGAGDESSGLMVAMVDTLYSGGQSFLTGSHYRGPSGFGPQVGYLRRVDHHLIRQRGMEALHLGLARRDRNGYLFCGSMVAPLNGFDTYCDTPR